MPSPETTQKAYVVVDKGMEGEVKTFIAEFKGDLETFENQLAAQFRFGAVIKRITKGEADERKGIYYDWAYIPLNLESKN